MTDGRTVVVFAAAFTDPALAQRVTDRVQDAVDDETGAILEQDDRAGLVTMRMPEDVAREVLGDVFAAIDVPAFSDDGGDP